MPKAHFSHVDAWVFDLDNTLYPARVRLFDQIDVKITRYVMDALGLDEAEADHLRQHYWQAHGTTLAGLMAEHGLDPDPYLVAVHDIDFSVLPPDADLAARIKALPGRRVVYTNGSAPYARQVIKARGLSGLFDAVYGVEHAGYRPKPERAAFEAVFAQDGIDPTRAAMFEDEPRNLAVPHAMGMRTVLIAPHRAPGDHIQFHSQDLGAFLSQL
ncbi:MAG: pyrimidine 5'-nucleotidase [Pseudomonadota bacterium]